MKSPIFYASFFILGLLLSGQSFFAMEQPYSALSIVQQGEEAEQAEPEENGLQLDKVQSGMVNEQQMDENKKELNYALFRAVERGDWREAATLINHFDEYDQPKPYADANVEYINVEGKRVSPLRIAIEKSDLAMVEILLGKYWVGSYGRWLDPEMQKIIPRKGASIDVIYENGLAPLTLARSLVQKYAKKSSIVPGTSSYKYSTSKNYNRIRINLLLQQAMNDLWRSEIVRGGKNRLEFLLQCGALINEVTQHNEFHALHFAVHVNDTMLIKFLIASGADVYAKTPYGHTPLSMAIEDNNVAVIDVLINDGKVNINKQFENTGVPLLLGMRRAVKQDNFETVEYLLKHGADLYQEDEEGNNALLLAYKLNAYSTLLPLLIRYGADVDRKNSKGITLFDCIQGDTPLSDQEKKDLIKYIKLCVLKSTPKKLIK